MSPFAVIMIGPHGFANSFSTLCSDSKIFTYYIFKVLYINSQQTGKVSKLAGLRGMADPHEK